MVTHTVLKVCVTIFISLASIAQAASLDLRLTGEPVTSSFVAQQIASVYENLYGVKISPLDLSHFTLAPYQTKRFVVPVVLPQNKIVTLRVKVTNELLPSSQTPLLLFSDHPETLSENGLLFSSGVIFLRPVRLNYYHENGPKETPRTVIIRLDNKNNEPAFVRIIEARSGPSRDEIGTGHQAGLLFLHRMSQNLSRIESIPPNSSLILSRQTANPRELVTGFIQVEELKGHPLVLGVFAEDPNTAGQKPDSLLESHDMHARGAYEMSQLYFKTNYTVGEDPTIISLGDLPLKNLLPGQPLKGAYGMFWEGDILIDNPFSVTEKIPINFQPRGGAAAATFIINQVYKEIPASRSYENRLIVEVTLPPKSKKKIHLLSMPEGGSSYPVNLIVGRMKPL